MKVQAVANLNRLLATAVLLQFVGKEEMHMDMVDATKRRWAWEICSAIIPTGIGKIILGAISSHSFLFSPATRQDTTTKTIDAVTVGRIQRFSSDMAVIDMGKHFSRPIGSCKW